MKTTAAAVMTLALVGCASSGEGTRPTEIDISREWSLDEIDRTADYDVVDWSDRQYEATDMRFLPDGRALLATKGGWAGPGVGELELLDQNGVFVRTLLQLPVCSDNERGLLGIEVDPRFPEQPLIYLFYTSQMSDCAVSSADEMVWPNDPPNPVFNRVSSFVFDEQGIDPASERVVVDRLPGHQSSHNGGGLAFMSDHTLLIGTGEATYGLSRRLDVPMGKILRVDPDHPDDPPADNPYASADGIERFVYASGFRNPFRLAVDASSGMIVVGDVGTEEFEEIDVVQPGNDYGFPSIEGPGSVDGSAEPVLWYRHVSTATCNSIIGGSFAPSGFIDDKRPWWIFSDLGCASVWALGFDGDDASSLVRIAPTQPLSATNIVSGQDGSLYIVGIAPGPQAVRRISPRGVPSSDAGG